MAVPHQTKFIFVTGGVVSGVGKGVTAASIGALLECRGLKISMTKMDPYINVDPGTMSPFQHGEVFVTDDGAETDLDLGHYQRFTHVELSRKNSFTTGQVYDQVIAKERKGAFLGGTVQVIPHVTDQIKENIYKASQNCDIAIIEIGGTVGDIESLPFLEAMRQFRNEEGRENVIFMHVTYIPYIKAAGELKTKPTQHSVRTLNSLGIQPEILICRTEYEVPLEIRKKISQFCNVSEKYVFEALDCETIYEVPLVFHRQGLDERVIQLLGIWTGQPLLKPWEDVISIIKNPKSHVKIAIVGKYLGNKDSYKSLYEALIHAGIANETCVDMCGVDSELISALTVEDMLSGFQGVIVPGGFGDRGIIGKILAARWARENKIPFLGICLGMQIACLEFARHILNISDATSEEFDSKAKNRVIHLMDNQQDVTQKGGSMRLGSYDCVVRRGTRTYEAYACDRIAERHRHRYEFNPYFREAFEKAGMWIAGESPDGTLVEVVELKDHPWYVGCQFHPELKSRLHGSHPLFKNFIHAVKVCVSSSDECSE